jgi:predicted nucleotidyltransferase
MAHCYRCGFSWFPRWKPTRMCARCKSPYFDTPKLRIPIYGSGLGIEEVIGHRRRAVLRLAERYGARNVRVFGSVARRTATSMSDLDLLVDPVPSRLNVVHLGLRLEKLLGRHVDVVTEGSLGWYIQPQVIAEAIPL